MSQAVNNADLNKKLRNTIFVLTLFFLLTMTGGCAGSGQEKSGATDLLYITRIMTPEIHNVKTSVNGPGNAVSGLVRGTLFGFLYGTLNPAAWMMGGPLTTMTVEGARGTACGLALGKVDNPSAQLKVMVANADLIKLHEELRSELHDAGMLRDEDSVAEKFDEMTTVLEIQKIDISLNGYMADDMFVSECQPYLAASATWRVIKIADNQPIRAGVTTCSNSPSSQTYQEWFMDTGYVHNQINWLLQRMGNQVANDLIKKNKNLSSC